MSQRNEQRHIIKRQILELRLNSKAQTFELQNKISEILQRKILPLLEECCNQLSRADEIDRIDKLEINLGNIDINHLEVELTEKFVTAFYQILIQTLRRSQPASNVHLSQNSQAFQRLENLKLPISPSSSTLQQTTTNSNSITLNNSEVYNNSRIQPVDSSRPWTVQEHTRLRLNQANLQLMGAQLELLSYFIQTGLLPWWANRLNQQEMETNFDRLFTIVPHELQNLFFIQLKKQTYLKRIIYQFSDQILVKIATLFAPNLVVLLEKYNDNLFEIYPLVEPLKSIEKDQFRLQYWQGVFLYLSEVISSSFNLVQFVEASLLHIATSFKLDYRSLINQILRVVESSQFEIQSRDSQLSKVLHEIASSLSTNSGKLSSDRNSFKINQTFNQDFIEKTSQSNPIANLSALNSLTSSSKISTNTANLDLNPNVADIASVENLANDQKNTTLDISILQEAINNQDNVIIDLQNFNLEHSLNKVSALLQDLNTALEELNQPDVQKKFLSNLVRSWLKKLPELKQLIKQSKYLETIEILEQINVELTHNTWDKFTIKNSSQTIQNQSKEIQNKVYNLQHLDFLRSVTVEFSNLNQWCQHQQVKQKSTSKPAQQSLKVTSPNQTAQYTLKDVQNWNSPFTVSDEIYIYNAGLVILWPFLDRFFQNINFIEQNQFIDRVTAHKAALLLQYCVEVISDIPEYLLPLNKVLCGLEILDPIERNLEVNELLQTECHTLLNAVIANWTILKGTSIEGLQRSFLQRQGILKTSNGSWLLQVECRTYDVLLDQLPWSIRVVKLPWMTDILYVEW